ncbi:MAG: hypothetical protein J0I12_07260 [Candidatus Eremiobacteraeota bacterium]|nr:hypothetical protein [Candidatus Eremiobacteraeota bacterium]
MTSHVATSAALPTGLGVAAFHAAQAGSTGLATGLGIAAGMTALPCAAGALLPIIFSGGSKSAVAGTVTGLALVATAAAFLLAGVPGF